MFINGVENSLNQRYFVSTSVISFKEISTGGVQISSVKLSSEPAKSQETDEGCPLKTRMFALRAVFQFSQQLNLPV